MLYMPMKKDIYLDQVRRILRNHLKGFKCRIFLFGSQSTQHGRRTSDIDIGLFPIAPLPTGLLSEIREELEESHIPYPVDLVDLSKKDPGFVEHVISKGILWND